MSFVTILQFRMSIFSDWDISYFTVIESDLKFHIEVCQQYLYVCTENMYHLRRLWQYWEKEVWVWILEHPFPGRRLPGCVPWYIKSIPSQTEAALLEFLLLHKDETPFDTFCFCCLLWGNVFHTNLAHGWNDVGSQKHGVKQHHWNFSNPFFLAQEILEGASSGKYRQLLQVLWQERWHFVKKHFKKFPKYMLHFWFCVKVRQGISLTLSPSTTSRENAPVPASPVIPRFGTFKWLENQPSNSGKAGKNDQKKGFPGWKVFERRRTNQHWTSINFLPIDFFLTAAGWQWIKPFWIWQWIHWRIKWWIWVILRCWGNSSILCQQNSDAL